MSTQPEDETPAEKRAEASYEGGYAQLESEDTLLPGDDDPLERGYEPPDDPPEHYQALDEEQSLDERLAAERPDVDEAAQPPPGQLGDDVSTEDLAAEEVDDGE